MSETRAGDGTPLETMESRLAALHEHIESHRRRSGDLRQTLESLTSIDPVTGVRNRFGITQSIEGALQWNAREGTPFGVAAVQVPALAEVAARETPDVIEEATAHVAAVLSAGLRAVDRVGRWSEVLFFVVLAKLGDEEGAVTVARRLRSMLAAVPFEAGDREYHLEPVVVTGLVPARCDGEAGEVIRRLEEALGTAPDTRSDIIRLG